MCLLCADTGAANLAETAAELKAKNRSHQASIDPIPILTLYQ